MVGASPSGPRVDLGGEDADSTAFFSRIQAFRLRDGRIAVAELDTPRRFAISSRVLDVFSSAGTFLGTVKPVEELRAFVVCGSRVIGLSETADGEHVIHVYRIE